MRKRYDATTKSLLEAGPDAWLALTGVAADGPLTPLDTDVSTVTAAVDGVFQVNGPLPWVVHFEFQSSADGTLAQRLVRYNVLLDDRRGLPVLSIAVLLRPSAGGPTSSGFYERRLPDGTVCHTFRYAVVRVWEIPVISLLEGGLATLPLALIADVGDVSPAAVAKQVGHRLETEVPHEAAKEYWAATMVLAGLRFPRRRTIAVSRRSLHGYS